MEQDTIKIVKRTVGLLLLLAVAAGTAGVLLWFFGSPWAAAAAERDIQAYVQLSYPGRNLEIGKADYNLSIHGYQALVQDPLQQDGYFTVSVKDGQILSDSYEKDVGEKGNTIRRMEQTYTQLVQKRLEELEWPAPINPVVRLDKSSTELVQLGMEFSQKGALVYHLMLEGTEFPPTLDGAVQLLGQVYAQMETAEYAFASYGVQLEKDGSAITVAQVLPSQIKGGNLARILQLALEGDSENGVYISIQTPPADQEGESTSADQ